MLDLTTMASSEKKKHWWVSNRKLVGKYLREARDLVATREHSNVFNAVGLLDAALALSPRHEAALELKARSLLFLRRFREVADMLQDYIPSCAKVGTGEGDSSTSVGSAASAPLNEERFFPRREKSVSACSFRCFSIADLKRKVLAGLSSIPGDGHWRYLVLGHACSRLGLMEDALVLLQTGRRLAAAASRRRSVSSSGDSFISFSDTVGSSGAATESESASQLISHIKLLLRRTSAAAAALEVGAASEAVRHFSKVLDGRRGVPAAYAAGCFVGRASAHRLAGRLAEAIADCNRALAVEPSCITALRTRADLLEAVGAILDCLRDLDHLKLLYDSILRDGKLPGPSWRPHHGVRYRDVATEHRALTARVQQLKNQVAATGGIVDVDYYALMGVRRGCTKSELERANLLLMLRHKPEKSAAFVERLEFGDDHRDPDSARDQAKMSATILYRLLQKGYSRITATVMEQEAAAAAVVERKQVIREKNSMPIKSNFLLETTTSSPTATALFQGMFCRDITAAGSVLPHGAIPVK
ncbi:uncharacterized protein LOC122011442 [Zingiber officinale]|uniref:J domain-containing protein n=1 Tax=Zingiber officinale TaxID=94328 RepID=A0A8J5FDD6_ZINOF|nr:uncharacterized protein LOC122011442 [Zingiber officinale]KAG6485082.1 hypothetical protein ZIOFF_053611 [Zingiber officinale]